MKTKYNICDNLTVDVEYDYNPQCYSDGDPTEIPDVTVNEVLVDGNDMMILLSNETLMKIKEFCLEHYCHYVTE